MDGILTGFVLVFLLVVLGTELRKRRESLGIGKLVVR
jgi:hypothetical protein